MNDPLAQSNVRNRMGYYLAQLLSEGAIAEEPAADAEAAATAIDEIVSEDAPAAEAPAVTPEAEPAAE